MNIREMLDNIPGAIENLDIDEALDLRDSEEFDSEWMRIYNLVEQRKNECEDSGAELEEICEMAYLNAFDTREDDEIASYVADDFGLMYDTERLGISDPWLDKLIDCYRRSVFPCGRL